MSAAEEANYCDGPKLMAWLREVEPHLWESEDNHGNTGSVTRTLGGRWNRRFYDWDRGSQPDVWTVDKLCVSLGRHLLEIPDDVFLLERRKKRPSVRKPNIDKAKALDMIVEGYLPTEIAREVGVTAHTVNKWKRQQGRKPYWEQQAA